MSFDKDNTDIAWHRWFARRVVPGDLGESRARGAYINARTAMVLAASLIAVVVALALAFMLHGHI